MRFDDPWMWPWMWLCAGVALAVAGVAGRALRGRRWAGLAVGLGVVAGLALLLGLVWPSPRQVPERLPALALLMLASGAVALLLPTRAAPAALVVGAVLAGWWMAGAPLHPPDMQRAGLAWLAIAALTLALGWRMAGGRAVLAAAALAVGLAVATPPGPYLAVALVVLGATLGGWATGARLAALPVAGVLAGLAAAPVLARGTPADVAVALLPLGVVWLVAAWRRR